MTPVHIVGESVIGPRGDWLWCCIPKNASRSLLRLLTSAGGIQLSAAGPDARARIAHDQALFSFGFVRHPEARVISAWRSKVRSPARTPWHANLLKRSPGLKVGMALNDFVSWLDEAFSRENVDNHFRRQCDYLCDKEGKVAVSFVGRIESLDADLATVGTRVGVLPEVPHLNAKVAYPDEKLTTRSQDILRNIYRGDFDTFGYEPIA
jgi:hypothetical protein